MISDEWAESPLSGHIFCCTGVEASLRGDIIHYVNAMGGVHKSDLMSDVQYLIVGSRDTPKYEFAVKHRMDMVFMRPEFIPSLFRRWQQGEELSTVREELQSGALGVFEGLQICCTNISLEKRSEIISLVQRYNGQYLADLTRKVTHLVSPSKSGRKYKYAQKWGGISIVSPKWIYQSIERGACLREEYFSLDLPENEIGVGSFIKKAAPTDTTEPLEQAEAPRLRLTISQRHRANPNQIWGSVLESIEHVEVNESVKDDAWDHNKASSKLPDKAQLELDRNLKLQTAGNERSQDEIQDVIQGHEHQEDQNQQETGMFADQVFEFYGFDDKKLEKLRTVVTSHGGKVNDGIMNTTLFIASFELDPRNAPRIEGYELYTELLIERSLYKKALTVDHWGKFIWQRNISGFNNLRVSLSGYSGIEAYHLPKIIRVLGGLPQEVINKDCDLLISLPNSRKFRFALHCEIPIVSADWLFEVASQGSLVDLSDKKFVLDGKEAQRRILLPRLESDKNGVSEKRRASVSETDSSETARLHTTKKTRRIVGRAAVSTIPTKTPAMTLENSRSSLDEENEESRATQIRYLDPDAQLDNQKLLEELGGVQAQEEMRRTEMTPAEDLHTKGIFPQREKLRASRIP
uniref:ARAD1D22242p n=1 Tax=Blastobotrys adeninivorans TaxID=409370 RepID=A0A060TAS3_BLAAD